MFVPRSNAWWQEKCIANKQLNGILLRNWLLEQGKSSQTETATEVGMWWIWAPWNHSFVIWLWFDGSTSQDSCIFHQRVFRPRERPTANHVPKKNRQMKCGCAWIFQFGCNELGHFLRLYRLPGQMTPMGAFPPPNYPLGGFQDPFIGDAGFSWIIVFMIHPLWREILWGLCKGRVWAKLKAWELCPAKVTLRSI